MSADTPDSSPNKAPLRQWHRAFGIALMDVFAGAPWTVELEQEVRQATSVDAIFSSHNIGPP